MFLLLPQPLPFPFGQAIVEMAEKEFGLRQN
jgi:hypothetical protein